MQSKKLTVFSHIFFIVICILSFVPILMAVLISISNETDVIQYGYKIIPMHIDFSAYKVVFSDISSVAKATAISLLSSTVAPALMVVICGAIGYALSQPQFKPRKYIMYFIIFTMIFSPGLIPTYIVNTQYLGLGNNILIYVLINLASAWNIILFKTFFSQIPVSLVEAASIDGASQNRIFVSIIIPMSKSIVASVFFMSVLGRWNDYTVSLYYMTNKDLYSLQYFLQKALQEASFLKVTYSNNPAFAVGDIPLETLKFALAVVSCIPVLLAFPYIQKYFSKGMAVGSVKE